MNYKLSLRISSLSDREILSLRLVSVRGPTAPSLELPSLSLLSFYRHFIIATSISATLQPFSASHCGPSPPYNHYCALPNHRHLPISCHGQPSSSSASHHLPPPAITLPPPSARAAAAPSFPSHCLLNTLFPIRARV